MHVGQVYMRSREEPVRDSASFGAGAVLVAKGSACVIVLDEPGAIRGFMRRCLG